MMNLGAGIPGLELLPLKRLNRILGMLARRCDAAGINYDFPPGFESLRRQIAKRSLEWGCSLTADDIVTTNGAMEALNLSIRAVAKPGNIIAIESPTFYGTLQVIESLGMKAVEIPMHPQVDVELARPEDETAAGVAERELGRRRKGSEVEPAIDGTAAGVEVAVGDAVGPVTAAAGGIRHCASQGRGDVIPRGSRPDPADGPIAD